jgi:hypothetical protein
MFLVRMFTRRGMEVLFELGSMRLRCLSRQHELGYTLEGHEHEVRKQ